MKSLSKELDVPVLCLAQLNRKVEERADKRPMLSDLRESGSLEQDADIVLLLNRKEFYDPRDKPGMAQIIVAKNRHGATGDVDLVYQKHITRFDNYSRLETPLNDRYSELMNR